MVLEGMGFGWGWMARWAAVGHSPRVFCSPSGGVSRKVRHTWERGAGAKPVLVRRLHRFMAWLGSWSPDGWWRGGRSSAPFPPSPPRPDGERKWSCRGGEGGVCNGLGMDAGYGYGGKGEYCPAKLVCAAGFLMMILLPPIPTLLITTSYYCTATNSHILHFFCCCLLSSVVCWVHSLV